jgi:hypothetical protein
MGEDRIAHAGQNKPPSAEPIRRALRWGMPIAFRLTPAILRVSEGDTTESMSVEPALQSATESVANRVGRRAHQGRERGVGGFGGAVSHERFCPAGGARGTSSRGV